jgi:K+-transporting ATPase ATPase C chain
MWIKETVNALAACVVTFVLCAVAYPAAVWGAGQLLFPDQAEGSLVYGRERTVIGSELIAQPFASDRYLHPRPSAAGPNGYAADAASGSNLGTKNPALRRRIALDAARWVEQHREIPGLEEQLVPTDLVTASGSGLDPHISPEAARYQAARVARARVMPVDQVLAAIDPHIGRSGAILGAPPRVNVLKLNLALDGRHHPARDPLR